MRIARLAFVLTCCCCTATHGATYAGPAKLPSPKHSSESVMGGQAESLLMNAPLLRITGAFVRT